MPVLIITGLLTFAATNIDDIFILVVFFSQTNASLTNVSLRLRHVVVGQYPVYKHENGGKRRRNRLGKQQ
ncbi:MAG: hypothetical protein Fur0021_39930 [Candidatus Promineifilaceae bacterium]